MPKTDILPGKQWMAFTEDMMYVMGQHPWPTACMNTDPGGEWIWLMFTVSGLSTFLTEETVCVVDYIK